MQTHQSCTSSGPSDINAMDVACQNERLLYEECCEGPDGGEPDAAPKGCN